MQWDVQHYINAVWILVGIYWAVGIVGAKPTVKRQSTLSSAPHLAILSPLARYGTHALS
jgi:hypothetical protein